MARTRMPAVFRSHNVAAPSSGGMRSHETAKAGVPSVYRPVGAAQSKVSTAAAVVPSLYRPQAGTAQRAQSTAAPIPHLYRSQAAAQAQPTNHSGPHAHRPVVQMVRVKVPKTVKLTGGARRVGHLDKEHEKRSASRERGPQSRRQGWNDRRHEFPLPVPPGGLLHLVLEKRLEDVRLQRRGAKREDLQPDAEGRQQIRHHPGKACERDGGRGPCGGREGIGQKGREACGGGQRACRIRRSGCRGDIQNRVAAPRCMGR